MKEEKKSNKDAKQRRKTKTNHLKKNRTKILINLSKKINKKSKILLK